MNPKSQSFLLSPDLTIMKLKWWISMHNHACDSAHSEDNVWMLAFKDNEWIKNSINFLVSVKFHSEASPQFLLHMHHHNQISAQRPNMKQWENPQGICGED